MDQGRLDQLAIRLTGPAAPRFSYDPDIQPDDDTVILRPLLGSGAILPVPLSHQPALGEVAIFEWTEYLLKGPGLQQVKLGSQRLPALDQGLYKFELKNQVGRLRLTLINQGRRYQLPVAVLSPKYPSPGSHLAFLGALLEDLIKRSAALPFAITQSTAFAADESPEPPTLLFVYHFLRQYWAELQAALETILASPHRSLIYRDELLPLAQAADVDAPVLEAILTQPQFLARTSQDLPVARALNGLAPTHLWQSLAEETFDTPPNRFAGHFLAELAGWSARLAETGWLADHLPALEVIRDELAFARGHSLWQDVGPLNRFPAENQVLLKRRGYREWTDLWRRFHLARLPVWRQAQEAIDARDIATLYEIWCFFALVGRIAKVLTLSPAECRWQLDLADDAGLGYKSRVIFGRTGYKLTYNETFGHGRRRSYSVSLRPDFTLHGPDGLRLIFDAKFRFDRTVFEPTESDEVEPGQRVAKQADLYKMHTYRDALGAQAALTLYPGDRDVFYHTDALPDRGINWPEDWPALLGGAWTGIGAVTLFPDSSP